MFPLRFGLMVISYLCVKGKVITDQNEWNDCCPQCPWQWPYGDNLRAICQYYNNNPHYATLYNITNRIAIFSQFTLSNHPAKAERIEFAVEPQLINFHMHENQNMEQEEDLPDCLRHILGQNQATLQDYKQGSIYDKGHLNPSSGHNTSEESTATFTLTNAVPQVGSFNQGCWRNMEEATLNYVKRSCYPNNIVVGAIPGFSSRMHDRVNVPAYMWTTIKCHGTVVAFLAPNLPNAQIEQNKLMTLFYFHERFLSEFVTIIKTLYDAQSNDELENSIRELKTNRRFLENDPPQAITTSKTLKRCLAQYGA